jgi:hypothetical protein
MNLFRRALRSSCGLICLLGMASSLPAEDGASPQYPADSGWAVTAPAALADGAPVFATVTLSPEQLQNAHLVETIAAGESAPIAVQYEAGSPARLWWIMPGETVAGTTRTFRLVQGTGGSRDQPAVKVEANREAVVVRIGTSPVLQYNVAHRTPPAALDPGYGRSAHLHPCWTPAGSVVTDEFPPDHAHQSGIFLAHTKTEFEGRHPNFWDLLGGTGRVRHRAVTRTVGGPVFGELKGVQEHVDLSAPGGKVALTETWTVRVWSYCGPRPSFWVCDITSHLECGSESPVRLLQYHYGGMAWGGDRARFRTSAGDDRLSGNHTRPWWCDLSGPVGTQTAGITFITHPANFRAPEPLRIHPKMPYMVYSPSHLGDWEIVPVHPHVSRYRFVFHDGELPAATAEALRSQFSEPLQATPMAAKNREDEGRPEKTGGGKAKVPGGSPGQRP